MQSNITNLHLAYDEKVITRTIHYFEEALPHQNKFVILIPRKDYLCKHVKVIDDNVLYTVYNSKAFWEAVGDMTQYRNVIYHYLGDELVDFTLKIHHPNITWVVWGGDLYNEVLVHKGYELYAYPNDIQKGRKERLFPYIYRNKALRRLRRREAAISKIRNLCLAKCDLLLLNKYLPNLKFVRRDFFYYPVEDMLGTSLIGKECMGNNIFVGNSASYTNNHRKVFETLSKYDLKDRQVIVPLSYGEGRSVALKYGKELLCGNFVPLMEFIPLEEYSRIMLSANIFIYGNYRQEAWGNIVVALYLGAVVVLDPRNPFMKDLLDMGFLVFSTDNIGEALNHQLSVDEKKRNRDLINKLYSKDRMIELIKKSFG